MIAFLRNTWRGLTSMRTALSLLFLLALAAMPGALLPQLSLNASKVDEYIAKLKHPLQVDLRAAFTREWDRRMNE